MWNRLRPEDPISDLLRHAKRHLEPPSYVPCDIQKIISIMSQSQSMVVLDLQGDMGFSQLAKLLYTLRFGPEESSVSSTLSPTKPAGISLISRGSIVKSSMTPSQRLILSKSADRLWLLFICYYYPLFMSSGGSCGFSFCERKQKIQEYCPRHQKNLLTYFCANQTCL